MLKVEQNLMMPNLKRGWPGMLNHGMKLTQKLAELSSVVTTGDYRPTDQSHVVFGDLSQRIEGELAAFTELLNGDLAEFNAMLHQYQMNPIA